MENLFLDCSDSDLQILYQQYKEYQKAGIVAGAELKHYRKIYEKERAQFFGKMADRDDASFIGSNCRTLVQASMCLKLIAIFLCRKLKFSVYAIIKEMVIKKLTFRSQKNIRLHWERLQ